MLLNPGGFSYGSAGASPASPSRIFTEHDDDGGDILSVLGISYVEAFPHRGGASHGASVKLRARFCLKGRRMVGSKSLQGHFHPSRIWRPYERWFRNALDTPASRWGSCSRTSPVGTLLRAAGIRGARQAARCDAGDRRRRGRGTKCLRQFVFALSKVVACLNCGIATISFACSL